MGNWPFIALTLDPPVKEPIGEIDQQVEEHQEHAVNYHDTAEEEPVPVEDGIHEEPARSGNMEDGFHDDRTGQEIGGERSQIGDDG